MGTSSLGQMAAPATPPAPHGLQLPLKVGTRGSPLALTQTRNVIARLRQICPPLQGDGIAEHIIVTSGDTSQASGCRLADLGGKGLFSKELDEAMLAGQIDIAVHSLKDLETVMRPGIMLGCVLPREDARDALILGPSCGNPDPLNPWACLPHAAHIGTASVRRQAQLLHARPDLRVSIIRGNVLTRVNKVREGSFDATLLALAGLRRLGLAEHAALVIPPAFMLPAAGQGIVGITVRESDVQLRNVLASIEDAAALAASVAERCMLAALDGSCNTPIGAHAELGDDGQLHLSGLLASPDGTFLTRRALSGAIADAAQIGAALGAMLKQDAPAGIF